MVGIGVFALLGCSFSQVTFKDKIKGEADIYLCQKYNSNFEFVEYLNEDSLNDNQDVYELLYMYPDEIDNFSVICSKNFLQGEYGFSDTYEGKIYYSEVKEKINKILDPKTTCVDIKIPIAFSQKFDGLTDYVNNINEIYTSEDVFINLRRESLTNFEQVKFENLLTVIQSSAGLKNFKLSLFNTEINEHWQGTVSNSLITEVKLK